MSSEFKNCQFCGEEILLVAKKCKHCMSDLTEPSKEENEGLKTKTQKKVNVKAGFSDESRSKNILQARKKWEGEGWSVIEEFNGGLTKTSYLLLEKYQTEEEIKKGSNKEVLGGCLIIIVIALIIGMFFGSTDDATVKNNASNARLEFPLNVDDFMERYNQSFKTLGRDINLFIKDENDNGSSLTIQVRANNNKNIGLVLSANNKNRILQSITFIGSGDGTSKSGLDIIFGAVAVIMAIEDPYMSVDGRGEIARDIGLSNGNLSKKEDTIIERNGIKYNISLSETIGFFLIAESIK